MTALAVVPDAGAEAVTAAVLASLPVSFSPGVADLPTQVAVVSGVNGWPRAVDDAVRLGRAVILVHPEPEESPVTPAGTVVIDWAWAANPAVAPAAVHFRQAALVAQLAECQLVCDRSRTHGANLLDLATLVRRLIGPVTGAALHHVDSHGFLAELMVGQTPVVVTVLDSTAVAPEARVRLLTDTGGVELIVPHPVTARPATVTVTDTTGVRQLPTQFESAHRVTWRRLRDLVAAQAQPDDLENLRCDLAALAPVLRRLDRW